MEEFRRLLKTPAGKTTTAILAALLVLLAVRSVFRSLKGDTPDSALYTTYICTETGKTFRHRNRIGEVQPIESPHSGKNTGVTAEACYWNADGTIKSEPTWVLLNELAGKSGPTFCPDCGRRVVAHNPQAVAGAKPPPTRDSFVPRDSGRASRTDDR